MDLHIAKRTAPLLIMDIIATYVAYWLASLLTNVFDEVFTSNEIFFILGILAVVNIAIMGAFRLYNNLWEYASVDEALQIVLSVVISTLVGAVFLWVINVRLPIRVFIGASILLVFLMGGYRLLWRIKRRKKRAFSGDNVDRPRTLVVGAGETGSLTINRMATKDPNMPGIPIVATDDDPAKRGLRIHGVKVEGSTDDIEELVRKYDIQQIVVAIPSSTPAERKRIYRVCTKTECVLKTLPNIRDLRIDELGDVALRDVDVTDLLGREEVQLDMRIAYAYVAGETVLVTGGGGSIGSELCRQLAKVAPRRIVIFDICENDAYMLRQELLRSYDDISIDIEIGSICNEARVNEVFEKYHPAVVFHAAAHKHVPLMEVCPREAIENNVFGIEIPTEMVTEIKEGGRRVESEKKVFPGYVLVRMELDNRSWAAVRNTPGVTGFVGSQGNPEPLTREEYNKIMKRTSRKAPKRTSTNLEVGQTIKVVSGPLSDLEGVISEVSPEAGKVKVLLSIFGRETPVELTFDQVARV